MPSFVALDAVLGWPAAVFDGSANQWNAYMNRASGQIASDAWRTDLHGRSNTTLTYSGTLVIDPKLNALYRAIDDPRANQIENEDREYMSPVSAPPTSVGGGEASGC